MPTIADQIARLQQAKADIKTAIEGKGVTVPSSALIDTYDDYVAQIQQGGGGNPTAPDNDVIFIDYDGTIRYSYTAAEFAQLTALPANPTHEGLTAQGWNWELADAKTYVAANGGLTIGQMYVTDDGKTRLYVTVDNIKTVRVNVRQTAANGVSFDWGDGSQSETYSGTGEINATHTYAASGSYVILLTVTSGTLSLGPQNGNNGIMGGTTSSTDTPYWTMLRKVEMGSSCNLSNIAFNCCRALESITIRKDATIGYSAFQNCWGLRSVTLPSNITIIGGALFSTARALFNVSLPKGVTQIALNWFNGDGCLARIEIPSSVTTIGNDAFKNNDSLSIVRMPQSGVTTFGNTVFHSCYSLARIDIPSTVTTMGNQVFYGCQNLRDVYVYPEAPPSLGTNIFYDCPADMVIHIPNGKLTTYQQASGWNAYSTQMVEMPAS